MRLGSFYALSCREGVKPATQFPGTPLLGNLVNRGNQPLTSSQAISCAPHPSFRVQCYSYGTGHTHHIGSAGVGFVGRARYGLSIYPRRKRSGRDSAPLPNQPVPFASHPYQHYYRTHLCHRRSVGMVDHPDLAHPGYSLLRCGLGAKRLWGAGGEVGGASDTIAAKLSRLGES